MKKITIVLAVAIVIILFGVIWLVLLTLNQEPHFKITQEGVDVDGIKSCSIESCGDISRQDLTKEWLEENCRLGDSRNEYECGNYLVEVWNQIK